MMIVSQCLRCKNFIDDKKFTCNAFPNGIPEEIIINDIEHGEPLSNQKNNIVFEEIK